MVKNYNKFSLFNAAIYGTIEDIINSIYIKINQTKQTSFNIAAKIILYPFTQYMTAYQTMGAEALASYVMQNKEVILCAMNYMDKAYAYLNNSGSTKKPAETNTESNASNGKINEANDVQPVLAKPYAKLDANLNQDVLQQIEAGGIPPITDLNLYEMIEAYQAVDQEYTLATKDSIQSMMSKCINKGLDAGIQCGINLGFCALSATTGYYAATAIYQAIRIGFEYNFQMNMRPGVIAQCATDALANPIERIAGSIADKITSIRNTKADMEQKMCEIVEVLQGGRYVYYELSKNSLLHGKYVPSYIVDKITSIYNAQANVRHKIYEIVKILKGVSNTHEVNKVQPYQPPQATTWKYEDSFVCIGMNDAQKDDDGQKDENNAAISDTKHFGVDYPSINESVMVVDEGTFGHEKNFDTSCSTLAASIIVGEITDKHEKNCGISYPAANESVMVVDEGTFGHEKNFDTSCSTLADSFVVVGAITDENEKNCGVSYPSINEDYVNKPVVVLGENENLDQSCFLDQSSIF